MASTNTHFAVQTLIYRIAHLTCVHMIFLMYFGCHRRTQKKQCLKKIYHISHSWEFSMTKNYANLFQFVLFEKIRIFFSSRERNRFLIIIRLSSLYGWKEFYHFDLQLLSSKEMFLFSFFQTRRIDWHAKLWREKKREKRMKTLGYQWARIDKSLPESKGSQHFVDFVWAILLSCVFFSTWNWNENGIIRDHVLYWMIFPMAWQRLGFERHVSMCLIKLAIFVHFIDVLFFISENCAPKMRDCFCQSMNVYTG